MGAPLSCATREALPQSNNSEAKQGNDDSFKKQVMFFITDDGCYFDEIFKKKIYTSSVLLQQEPVFKVTETDSYKN